MSASTARRTGSPFIRDQLFGRAGQAIVNAITEHTAEQQTKPTPGADL